MPKSEIPTFDEILEVVGSSYLPSKLIEVLSDGRRNEDVIEGLQRAIERERITLNGEGMVVPVGIGVGA